MIDKLWTLLDYVMNHAYNKNVPIIWSYQNAARIKKPYIVIDYTTNDLPNFDITDQFVDANGIRTLSSWRKVIADIQFYDAKDSMTLANFMAMALATEASLTKQVELDCSIGNRLFFQRIPALLNNSQYEDRAIYQFDFFYTETLREDVGFIATVVIDGSYTGGHTDIDYPPETTPIEDRPITCHEIITIPYPDTSPPDYQTYWDSNGTQWDHYTTWDDL